MQPATHEQIDAGSSPLTRGKPPIVRLSKFITGLIPAHAGKTVLRDFGAGACAAHPRSRGENSGPSVSGRPFRGSSPLTRGKPLRHRASRDKTGLIPAHAGKTVFMIVVVATETAHPRSRGENTAARGDKVAGVGSSPLTRGKQLERRQGTD